MELYIFISDSMVFASLNDSLAQRRPEFQEGSARVVILFMIPERTVR